MLAVSIKSTTNDSGFKIGQESNEEARVKEQGSWDDIWSD